MFNIQRPSRNLRNRLSRNRQRLRETAGRLTLQSSTLPSLLDQLTRESPLPLPEQLEAELGLLFRKYRLDIITLSYTYRHRNKIEAYTIGMSRPECTSFADQMRIAVLEAINKLFHDS